MSEIPDLIHPEFGSEWTQILKTQDSFEASFQDKINTLRADVITRLSQQGIVGNSGWLYYVFPNDSLLDDSDDGHADCAVILEQKVTTDGNLNPIIRPSLRFLYSEQYEYEDGIEYFTIDIAVDHEGDAQYAIGTFCQRQDVEDLDLPWSNVPLVTVCDQSLGLFNMGDFADVDTIYPNGSKAPIYPTGIYHSGLDAMEALNRAIDLFDRLREYSPFCTGTELEYMANDS